jgi:hypothetical protein
MRLAHVLSAALAIGLGCQACALAWQRLPEGTKPFAFDRGAGRDAAPTACGFPGLELPAQARIFAAGAYGGSTQPWQIDDSGHGATRMDVAVNHRQSPVVLMLGSYEPAVWSVGWTPGTRILAVLLSGYHRQVITGLPAGVPVLVSSYDNKGPCGYFHVSADRASRLNPIARQVFGRPVDMLYLARDGKVVVGDPLSSGDALVTDRSARPPESFRRPDSQLAGPAGLERAVRDGYLRPATQADVDAWFSALQASPRRDDVPPVAGGAPRPRIAMIRGYVVTKAYTLPPGLYGANSATFFVPRGVPRPQGSLGHSTLYDFNTLTCSGVACGIE